MSFLKNNWVKIFTVPKSRSWLISMFVCLIGSAFIGANIPILIKSLFGQYEIEHEYFSTLKLLGGLFLLEYLVRLVYQFSIERYVLNIIQYVRTTGYNKWLATYEIHRRDQLKDAFPMGEVMARIMNDSESIREMVTSGAFTIFIDIVFIVSCLLSFLQLNLRSGIFLIVLEVIIVILLIYGSRRMRGLFHAVRKATGHMSRVLADMTGGLYQGFFMPAAGHAHRKSQHVLDDFLKKQLRANVWDAGYYSIAESLFPILLAIMVLAFPYSHITQLAIVAAIIDLIQRSISPIKDVAGKLTNIQRAMTGMRRFSEFTNHLERLPATKQESQLTEFHLKQLSVEISHFRYGNSDFSLKDLFVEATPGELIGIVGISGSGKSTFLKILAGEILPQKGSVRLLAQDDTSISLEEKGLQAYRQQVSIVSQESHIFSAPLGFNISLGQGDPESLTKFWAKAKEELDYLNHWGVSLETPLTSKGQSLGQKQLISALRACYLRRPVVLFDEISSALDGDLELALRRMVLLIQRQSLTFIVAHRLETVQKANQLLVLEGGRLVGKGSHEDLSQNSTAYNAFIQELSSNH